MAFFRFSRDKRGYEHFYLVEPVANRRGKSRPRVLYWFRTPPNVKIGREPFDDDVRRALEAQNPNVAFDWRKILEAPIPSADADKWRERRRVERAARHAARGGPGDEEESAPQDDAFAEQVEPTADDEPIPTVVESAAAMADAPSQVERAVRRRRRRRRGRGPQQPAPSVGPASVSADADVDASQSGEDEAVQAQDEVADEPSGE